MDPGLVAVLVAVVGVVPSIVTGVVAYFQSQRTKAVAAAVSEESGKRADDAARVVEKLDTIHTLVNSQLTEAVERFKASQISNIELKAIIDQLSARKDVPKP